MAEQGQEEKLNNTLELQGVIGYNGSVREGLILHPGDQHIIYPLGSTIVVKHLTENTQTFLQKDGHNRSVSCLALSSSGKYLASGQITHMGFPASVIIWNLETYEIVHKLSLHKGAIQDLAFSPNEQFLVTLGGRDDNKLVIWDVESGEAICGSTAANETALTVRFFNNRDDMLVTGGHYNLRVWQFDLANRKIRPSDAHLGQLKRIIKSITIDDDDEFMYCGTETGDLLQVSLGPKLFKGSGPRKRPFSLGIACVTKTKTGDLIVGAGDGTVALLRKDSFKIVRRTKLHGGVTSLALNAAGDHVFVGTDKCNIYLLNIASFEYELRNTCHFSRINDIAYPRGYSQLFATCSVNDIRVWHAGTRNELLRIQVPNLECLCICFSPDGKSIVSGWDDGKIRAFRPQTGKLMYAINDAHRDGVTAITMTSDCRRIISGGQEGQVRVWAIGRQTQKMIASMKEHKGRVNCVQVNNEDTECVSASADGSCIVWSLERFVRNTALFASTQFKAIVYHPDQSQLLSTGTDRKLTYWDLVDGNPIRIIDGSTTDQINCIAITEDGDKFVSGGGEKMVKLWGYDEGYCYYVGVGHSGAIVQCKVSPDQQTIVTVGDEGAIFLWSMPDVKFSQEEREPDQGQSGGGQQQTMQQQGGGQGQQYEEEAYGDDEAF
jgi:WD40 repeat protein